MVDDHQSYNSENKLVKVAVIQQPPEYLNLTKSMELGVKLIETAAEQGSKLLYSLKLGFQDTQNMFGD